MKHTKSNMQQEYDKAMAILDRIEEKMDIMEKKLDEAMEMINNIPSNTDTTEEK